MTGLLVRIDFSSHPALQPNSAAPHVTLVTIFKTRGRCLEQRRRTRAACPAWSYRKCLFTPPVYNEEVTSASSVRQISSADFPTRWGRFRIYGFEGVFRDGDEVRREEAVALVMGDVSVTAPLVRIHSQCLTGDVFGSLRCDCRQQLEMALSMIANLGAGVLIYEQQEGRGIGLMAKLQAYELQDVGLDTVEANERLGFKADHREFALPSEMLKALGIREVRLLSNNPDKVAALEQAGVKVVERVPCEVAPTTHAEEYLKTKKEKLGHLFTSR
jgi:GTP cyclohydrolase II